MLAVRPRDGPLRRWQDSLASPGNPKPLHGPKHARALHSSCWGRAEHRNGSKGNGLGRCLLQGPQTEPATPGASPTSRTKAAALFQRLSWAGQQRETSQQGRDPRTVQ